MAKVTGPLFSMKASGSFGDIVFDKRGYARPKGNTYDRQTHQQGDFRQAMTVAQKCVKVCGPATRQLLRNIADEPGRWSAYLTKNLIGSDRAIYLETLVAYGQLNGDQAGWETAAAEAGLRPVSLDYASETEVSPGAQLFSLASTLFTLGLYSSVGTPNGNAAAWKSQIVS
ncbi:MAG: hypothetical protein HC875_34450 [Anaerolineales bacterium]|nr:hypothetical protein [Anaerolineales bacterium]